MAIVRYNSQATTLPFTIQLSADEVAHLECILRKSSDLHLGHAVEATAWDLWLPLDDLRMEWDPHPPPAKPKPTRWRK